jgi:hypothetical protein
MAETDSMVSVLGTKGSVANTFDYIPLYLAAKGRFPWDTTSSSLSPE